MGARILCNVPARRKEVADPKQASSPRSHLDPGGKSCQGSVSRPSILESTRESHVPRRLRSASSYGKLLSHPTVQQVLEAKAASYTLPAVDAQEIVASVFDALWRRRNDEDPPDTLSRLIALASTIFEGKLNDYFRRKAVNQARIVDASLLKKADVDVRGIRPHDQPNYVDEIAPQRSVTPEDALEAKEQLAFVQTQVDKGVVTPDDIEVMQAHQAGERTFEQLAAERGVRTETLRQRIHRLRKRLLKAWAEYSLVTRTSTIVFLLLLLLVVVTVVVAALRRKEPPPPPQPPPAPTQTAAPQPSSAPVREPFSAPPAPGDDKKAP